MCRFQIGFEICTNLDFADDSIDPTVIYAGDMTATVRGVKFDNFKNTCKLFRQDGVSET